MEDIVLIEAKNFGGHFLLKDLKGKRLTLPCYTKKQIKAFHPKKHPPPSLLGACRTPLPQCLSSKQDIPWQNGLLSIEPYKKPCPLFYHVKGYLPCKKEGTYILLYQSHKILLLFLSLIFCIGMLLFLQLLTPSNVAPPVLDENAVSWNKEEKAYPSDKLTFDGITQMRVNSKADRAKATFHNPKSNHCYAIVSLWIQTDEGWEELYQSGLLGPGQALYEIPLNHRVPSGRYCAYVKYKSYTIQDCTPLNEVTFHFTFTSE